MANDQVAFAQAINSSYQGINPKKMTIHVDPDKGSDSNDGTTWRRAVATIAKAVSIAPAGAVVVLSNKCRHDVGSGVTYDPAKMLTIKTENGTAGRNYNDYTTGSGVIYSSASTAPAVFLSASKPSGNVYGGRFVGLTFDTTNLAANGACVTLHAQNRLIFEDCHASQQSWSAQKWLIRADTQGGDDCSWNTVRGCTTTNVAGVFANGSEHNYWSFPQSSFTGAAGTLQGTALQFDTGNSQIDLSSLHLERWAIGAKFTGYRGLSIPSSLTGESIDVLVWLVNCTGSIVSVDSSAGDGWSRVQCDGTTTGIVFGTAHVQGTSNGVQYFNSRNNSFVAGTLPGNYSRVIPDQNTNAYPIPVGPEMPLVGSQDLALMSGWTADYTTDGTTWSSWYASNDATLNRILVDDRSEIVIDSAHKHCRFRTDESFNGSINGLLRIRMSGWMPNNAGNTITVKTLDSSNKVKSSIVVPFGDGVTTESAGVSRGVEVAIPSGGGDRLEVEFNFPGITASGQEMYIRRMSIIGSASEADSGMHGRFLQGRIAPNGNVIGSPGDLYQCIGAGAPSNAGLWTKTSGWTTNNGWVLLS